MKTKSRVKNAGLWIYYDDWEVLAYFDGLGYRLDDELVAQKLVREGGMLSKSARKYIADRYISRRARKRGRRPISAEEKQRSRRDRAIEFVNAIDAALNKVGGDWNRLPKKGLFSGTVQSAKQQYSRFKKIKDEWDREGLGYIRDAARYAGIPFDEYRARLKKQFSGVP
jgi:hypothetical protein